jgi:hypothetical protein
MSARFWRKFLLNLCHALLYQRASSSCPEVGCAHSPSKFEVRRLSDSTASVILPAAGCTDTPVRDPRPAQPSTTSSTAPQHVVLALLCLVSRKLNRLCDCSPALTRLAYFTDGPSRLLLGSAAGSRQTISRLSNRMNSLCYERTTLFMVSIRRIHSSKSMSKTLVTALGINRLFERKSPWTNPFS